MDGMKSRIEKIAKNVPEGFDFFDYKDLGIDKEKVKKAEKSLKTSKDQIVPYIEPGEDSLLPAKDFLEEYSDKLNPNEWGLVTQDKEGNWLAKNLKDGQQYILKKDKGYEPVVNLAEETGSYNLQRRDYKGNIGASTGSKEEWDEAIKRYKNDPYDKEMEIHNMLVDIFNERTNSEVEPTQEDFKELLAEFKKHPMYSSGKDKKDIEQAEKVYRDLMKKEAVGFTGHLKKMARYRYGADPITEKQLERVKELYEKYSDKDLSFEEIEKLDEELDKINYSPGYLFSGEGSPTDLSKVFGEARGYFPSDEEMFKDKNVLAELPDVYGTKTKVLNKEDSIKLYSEMIDKLKNSERLKRDNERINQEIKKREELEAKLKKLEDKKIDLPIIRNIGKGKREDLKREIWRKKSYRPKMTEDDLKLIQKNYDKLLKEAPEDMLFNWKAASNLKDSLEKEAKSLESLNKKRYWQMLKRLYGGTDEAVSALKKTRDIGMYHATDKKNIKDIIRTSLRPSSSIFGEGAYFGTSDLVSNHYLGKSDNVNVLRRGEGLIRVKKPSEMGRAKYPRMSKVKKMDIRNVKNIETEDVSALKGLTKKQREQVFYGKGDLGEGMKGQIFIDGGMDGKNITEVSREEYDKIKPKGMLTKEQAERKVREIMDKLNGKNAIMNTKNSLEKIAAEDRDLAEKVASEIIQKIALDEKQKDMGATALGIGSVPLTSASIKEFSNRAARGDLTDKEVLYHNTLKKNIPSIKQKGILSEYATDPNNLTNKALGKYNIGRDKLKGKVYLAKEKEIAQGAGEMRSEYLKNPDTGKTLKVSIPRQKIKRGSNPELLGAENLNEYLKRAKDNFINVNPEMRIKDIHADNNLIVPHIRWQLQEKGIKNPTNKQILEEIFEIPLGGRYLFEENYRNLKNSVVHEGDIASRYIKGGKGSKNLLYKADDLIQFIKRNPKKAAKAWGPGALALAGIAGTAAAYKEVTDEETEKRLRKNAGMSRYLEKKAGLGAFLTGALTGGIAGSFAGEGVANLIHPKSEEMKNLTKEEQELIKERSRAASNLMTNFSPVLTDKDRWYDLQDELFTEEYGNKTVGEIEDMLEEKYNNLSKQAGYKTTLADIAKDFGKKTIPGAVVAAPLMAVLGYKDRKKTNTDIDLIKDNIKELKDTISWNKDHVEKIKSGEFGFKDEMSYYHPEGKYTPGTFANDLMEYNQLGDKLDSQLKESGINYRDVKWEDYVDLLQNNEIIEVEKNHYRDADKPYEKAVNEYLKKINKQASQKDDKVGKDGKIKSIEDSCDNKIEKEVATMMATSHEYKTPNVDGALALVKNYKWEKGTEKLKNLQGIEKPIVKEKVLNMSKAIEKDKGKVKPLIVVNKLHGITPQTKGRKILLDGHHRKEALELLGKEDVPVYKGTFTGKAQKDKKELRGMDKKQALELRDTLEKIASEDKDLAEKVAKEILEKQAVLGIYDNKTGDLVDLYRSELNGTGELSEEEYNEVVNMTRNELIKASPEYREGLKRLKNNKNLQSAPKDIATILGITGALAGAGGSLKYLDELGEVAALPAAALGAATGAGLGHFGGKKMVKNKTKKNDSRIKELDKKIKETNYIDDATKLVDAWSQKNNRTPKVLRYKQANELKNTLEKIASEDKDLAEKVAASLIDKIKGDYEVNEYESNPIRDRIIAAIPAGFAGGFTRGLASSNPASFTSQLEEAMNVVKDKDKHPGLVNKPIRKVKSLGRQIKNPALGIPLGIGTLTKAVVDKKRGQNLSDKNLDGEEFTNIDAIKSLIPFITPETIVKSKMKEKQANELRNTLEKIASEDKELAEKVAKNIFEDFKEKRRKKKIEDERENAIFELYERKFRHDDNVSFKEGKKLIENKWKSHPKYNEDNNDNYEDIFWDIAKEYEVD
jgi:hypothetical protein